MGHWEVSNVVADSADGGLTISSKTSTAIVAEAATAQASEDVSRPLTADVSIPGVQATRVNVTVSGANDRPDAVSETQAVNVLEDGSSVSIDVLANDTDADLVDTADNLIINSATSANGAAVSIINGEVVYDPAGAEAFQSLGVGETMRHRYLHHSRRAWRGF